MWGGGEWSTQSVSLALALRLQRQTLFQTVLVGAGRAVRVGRASGKHEELSDPGPGSGCPRALSRPGAHVACLTAPTYLSTRHRLKGMCGFLVMKAAVEDPSNSSVQGTPSVSRVGPGQRSQAPLLLRSVVAVGGGRCGLFQGKTT